MMFKLLKLVPQISVAAVALLSIFTVGYFSKIGIHLLGVIDVTNLVYSFGLAFGLSMFFVTVFSADTAGLLRRVSDDDEFLAFIVKAWNWVGFPLFLLSMALHNISPHMWIPKYFSSDSFALGVFLLAATWMGAIVFVRHENESRVLAIESSALILFVALSVYNGGKYQAYHEVFESKTLFELTLRDSTIKDVRLVRSSSSGLIIAMDGVVRFVPKESVQMLTLKKPLEK